MSVFVDSNIVLYALGDDPVRREVAVALLDACPTISTQVVSECSHVLRRKQGLSADRIARLMEHLLAATRHVETTLGDVRQAWSIAGRYGLGHYDSLILASALAAGCTILYTEDMQHGQIVENRLELRNPFLPAKA